MTTEVTEELVGARNILMLASSIGSQTTAIHQNLLAKDEIASENLLVLTFRSHERWVRRLNETFGDLPAQTVIITLNETARNAEIQAEDISVISMSPTDLTGIGMAVSECITNWASDDAEMVVCFNSVTDFLQYADRSTMYRFLRVVTRRLNAVDGFAHFHMDPDAHDSKTVATLKSPFDAVVDVSTDGDVTVSTRY
jgi:hypothetical protein